MQALRSRVAQSSDMSVAAVDAKSRPLVTQLPSHRRFTAAPRARARKANVRR